VQSRFKFHVRLNVEKKGIVISVTGVWLKPGGKTEQTLDYAVLGRKVKDRTMGEGEGKYKCSMSKKPTGLVWGGENRGGGISDNHRTCVKASS